MPTITINDRAYIPAIYRLTNRQALCSTTIATRRSYRTTPQPDNDCATPTVQPTERSRRYACDPTTN